MAEQLAAETAAAAQPTAQVAGRPVLLVPHRGPGVAEDALPPEYQKILAVVRRAGAPVATRQVGAGGDGAGQTGAAAGEAVQARRARLAAQLAPSNSVICA
jgi:hypothetical protein